MSYVTMKIDGMKCEGCVSAVQKKLSQVRGVSMVAIDLANGKATVEIEDGEVGLDELVMVVRDAGYEASLTD